jgi:hypothetical protein
MATERMLQQCTTTKQIFSCLLSPLEWDIVTIGLLKGALKN